MASQDKPVILVEDDDPAVAETLAMVVEQGGYSPATAITGESAIYTASNIKPALALIDLVLPESPGLKRPKRFI